MSKPQPRELRSRESSSPLETQPPYQRPEESQFEFHIPARTAKFGVISSLKGVTLQWNGQVLKLTDAEALAVADAIVDKVEQGRESKAKRAALN